MRCVKSKTMTTKKLLGALCAALLCLGQTTAKDEPKKDHETPRHYAGPKKPKRPDHPAHPHGGPPGQLITNKHGLKHPPGQAKKP